MGGELDPKNNIGKQQVVMGVAGSPDPEDREKTGGIEASVAERHTAESVKPLPEDSDEEPGEDGEVASPMFQSQQG